MKVVIDIDKDVYVKPCPFCGGEAKLISKHWCTDHQLDDDYDIAYVECSECHSKSPSVKVLNARYRKTCKKELSKIVSDAIRAWNCRPERVDKE